MADRQVTASGKDSDGDITALCNPGAPWSPRLKGDAIADITTGSHTYFVQPASGRVDVHVVEGPSGPYLRTDPDASTGNNLDELPDC